MANPFGFPSADAGETGHDLCARREGASYITRLAPAPTGALHLGNARTFLIAWLRARQRGGQVILRMEDLDHPKVKPGAARQAYDDLAWLGLDWDAGPVEARGHPRPADGDPYVQSDRLPLYREALQRLARLGRLYPCVCTRKEIEAAQSAPHAGEEMRYPGICRPSAGDASALSQSPEAVGSDASGRPPAWRFRIDDERETRFDDVFAGEQTSRLAAWSGDFVVARAWDRPAYQLAVVVDDAAMGITEVIRADDLLPSTHRQLVLYDALDLSPPAFCHVPLVVGPDGRRLAKRHGDTRIASLRAGGVRPERVVGWLAATCGWVEPGTDMAAADLLPHFDLQTIPPKADVLDDTAKRILGLPE